MKEKCGNCRYFDKMVFCCKRHAPTFIILDRVYRTSFPNMYSDDWCGDWEEKRMPLRCPNCGIVTEILNCEGQKYSCPNCETKGTLESFKNKW